MRFATAMSALGLLLLVGAQGTTIISIKYPPPQQQQQEQSKQIEERTQPAKRDLSLSYAATNIDSKEGTRVKTITVIKNVGGVGFSELGGAGGGGSSSAASHKQLKLSINPKLHQNEEWANAFRDNFESFGGLPDVPDIDDLFDFVNRKKPEKSHKEKEQPTEKSATTTKTTVTVPVPVPSPTKASEQAAETEVDAVDSDEAIVEKIKGDAELLPHIKQANILRLQAQELRTRRQQQQPLQLQPEAELEQLSATPVSKYFENYVQVLPNGYDYTKPEPCASVAPLPNANGNSNFNSNSIQVTTPAGRHYDIPQNNSGSNPGINHPYLAPALNKRTQIVQAPPNTPNYSTVNSIVPKLPAAGLNGAGAGVGAGAGTGTVNGVGNSGASTSQRPYVAPSLRHINRAASQPTPLPPSLPAYANSGNALPSYRVNAPNTYRSRGLKY